MNNAVVQSTTLTSFSITNQPSSVACFTYSLVQAPGNTVAVSLPSYISFTYPTLTIGPTGLGILGTTPMISLTWSVAAQSVMSGGGATVFTPLTVTLYNECDTTTLLVA